MRCRAPILFLALLAAACGPREAEAPQSPDEAAREYEAAIRAGGPPAAKATPDAAASGAPADDAPYATECAIDRRGERFVQPCRYFPEPGGSFAIAREDGAPLLPGVASIGVFVTADGSAIVSATDPAGRAVRWGVARRATQNDDCWEGDGFWVCAG